MIASSVWQHASDNSIIEHILARYHQVHRQQLADILQLTEKVSITHSAQFPAAVLPLLQNLQVELINHMLKEERVLFPMILNGAGTNAAMPIQVMRHEHDEHTEAVAQLLIHTNNLTPPSNACGSWQRLYSDLDTLFTDLREHIALENGILFSRTLA